jgi:hypothetical protein
MVGRRVGIQTKGMLFLSKICQTVVKITNMKFHEHLSVGSQVVPCGEMGMTRLVANFYNFFVNVPTRLQAFSGPESEII